MFFVFLLAAVVIYLALVEIVKRIVFGPELVRSDAEHGRTVR